VALEGHKFSNFQGPSNEQNRAVLKRSDANSMHLYMVRIRLATYMCCGDSEDWVWAELAGGECARRCGARAVVETYASTYCDYSVRRLMSSSCGACIGTFSRPGVQVLMMGSGLGVRRSTGVRTDDAAADSPK